MIQYLGHIGILVKDYDEAIQFYTQKLGFILIEDTVLSEKKEMGEGGTTRCQRMLFVIGKSSKHTAGMHWESNRWKGIFFAQRSHSEGL